MSSGKGLLTIGYQNARGLKCSLIEVIAEVMKKNSIDLVVISEHWYTNDYRTYVQQQENERSERSERNEEEEEEIVLLEVADTTDWNPLGRQKGGIVFMTTRKFMRDRNVKVVRGRKDYWAGVTIDGMSFIGTYFPPSLKPAQVLSELNDISGAENVVSIFGDINVELGAFAHQHRIYPKERGLELLGWARRMGMGTSPLGPEDKVQHVLHCPHVPCKGSMSWLLDNFDSRLSDHPFMYMSFQVPRNAQVRVSDSTRSGATRLYQNFLKHERTRENIQKCLNILLCDIPDEEEVCRLVQDTLDSDGEDAAREFVQQWITDTDGLIEKSIWDVSKQYLGTYNVSDKRSEPDETMKWLDGHPSKTSSVKAYKRANRGAAMVQNYLTSRTEGVSAKEDVRSFFGNVYGGDAPDSYQGSEWRDVLKDGSKKRCFEAKDIHTFLKSYPKTKAPGIDSLNTVLMVAIDEHYILCTALRKLFNTCYTFGFTPPRWNESVLFLLPKVAEAPTVDLRRPISLTVMFRRAFEFALFREMSNEDNRQDLPDPNGFHPSQAGFRQDHSTWSHILVLHEEMLRSCKGAVFVDFAAAYDRVSLPLLIERMREHGCSKRFISIVGSLFYGGTSRACVNGELTEPIKRGRGLFQGSLLAPFLYNLYSNNLYENISSEEDEDVPKMLAFADDVALPITKGSGEWTKAQKCFDGVQTWATNHSMMINASKSGVVMGGTRSAIPQSNRFDALAELQAQEERHQQHQSHNMAKVSFMELFGKQRPVQEEREPESEPAASATPGDTTTPNQPIESDVVDHTPSVVTSSGDVVCTVPSYKYLGVDFGPQGVQFASTLSRMVRKAKGAMQVLEGRGSEWGPSLKLHVYKTFVRPTLEYGAPLTYTYLMAYPNARLISVWREAQEIHRSAMSFILGSQRIVNQKIHLSMLALETTEERFAYLADSFRIHLDRIAGSGTFLAKCRAKLESEPRPTRDRSLMIHFGKSAQVKAYDRMVKAWNQCEDWIHDGRVLKKNPNRPYSEDFQQAPSFKVFAKVLHLDSLQVNCILARYILPKSRTGQGVGVDKVVNIQERCMRRLLMDWRRNTYGHWRGHTRPTCPRGGHDFNRKCLKRCMLVQSANVEENQWLRYEREAREFEDRWSDASGYTIIDSLLNNQDFQDAATLLNFLYIHLFGSMRDVYYSGIHVQHSTHTNPTNPSTSSNTDDTQTTNTIPSSILQHSADISNQGWTDTRARRIDFNNPHHTPTQHIQYQQDILEGMDDLDRGFLSRKDFEVLMDEEEARHDPPQ